MSVISAEKRLPLSLPMRTIISASLRDFSGVSMIAPLPLFTSSTTTSQPAASFLDRIDDTTSGMQSTVAVTSRRA